MNRKRQIHDFRGCVIQYKILRQKLNMTLKSIVKSQLKKLVKLLRSVASELLIKKDKRKMTLSFFLTVLALSTPFSIKGATDEFHPPKSPFFAKLNPYLLFEDRMNLTEAQYRFGKYFRFEDPVDGIYNYGKGFWRGN